MDNRLFEDIGFSKGEVKVYFALLDLGESTIGPLSKKSEITAAKVYPILEKLIKKGLVSFIIKSDTKYFSPANPKRILEYLDEKEAKIKNEKNEIKKIIPEMELKLKFQKEPQNAQIYQTFDGLKTLYNEIIEILAHEKEDFIGFTLGEEEYKYSGAEHFFREYDVKRRALKIKLKLIGSEDQKDFMKKLVSSDRNITLRYLPYQMPTGLIIFADKVAILTWQEIPTAFVIQSKKIAENYKLFFLAMWKMAKS